MKRIALLLIVLTAFFQQGYAKESRDKTNVVLILIDDLSMYGVSAYGSDSVGSLLGRFENTEVTTPQIDKLAETGLLCNNAYAYPLCEATRIALMSGKYNNRNFLNCKAQHASDITFGDVFKKAGYATGMYGKWKQTRGTKEIHAKDYIFEFGWDDFCCFDVITEGKRFINPNLIINGEVHDYQMRTDLDPETGRRWYGPDICNRHALQFIEDNKDQPFFLYYPMLLVHDEHQPTPDTQPHSVFDSYNEGRNALTNKKGDDHKYFPDMIKYMDKLIGKVVDKLDELNLRENTLIVVMGDNGTKECFSHILPNDSIYPGRKGGTFDNGLHVPLVLNQSGRIEQEVSDQMNRYDGLVDITDIYPTICEAAGIDIPRQDELDGVSFWPQVMGNEKEARDHIYTWYNNNQAYTNEKELLIYAFDKSFKRYAPSEVYPEGRFFDLRTDPLEWGGDKVEERRFGLKLYSGLDLSKLTVEQQEAYERLGKIIDSYDYVAVESLEIKGTKKVCEVGEKFNLVAKVSPANAMRKNIVWESSNPDVVSVNKFGEIKAVNVGEATISVFSWDDALPLSANKKETYLRTGIQSSYKLTVK